ncbi:MAG: hypothetical protein AAGD14_06955 [Planctomycetota bacterium]
MNKYRVCVFFALLAVAAVCVVQFMGPRRNRSERLRADESPATEGRRQFGGDGGERGDRSEQPRPSSSNHSSELRLRFVMRSTQAPVPGVFWAIERSQASGVGETFEEGGFAGPDGAVALSADARRGWETGVLLAEASGFREARFKIEEMRLTGGHATLELIPQWGLSRVKGEVRTYQGAPVAGAWVRVKTNLYEGQRQADDLGQFEFTVPRDVEGESPTVEIQAGGPGFLVAERSGEADSPLSDPIRLKPDPFHAVLEITVVDGDRRPIPEVETRFEPHGAYSHTRIDGGLYNPEAAAVSGATRRFVHAVLGLDRRALRSDESGKVTIWGIPPGAVRVRCRAGRRYADLTLEAVPGSVVKTIQLRRGRDLFGRVTAGGEPASDVRLYVPGWQATAVKTDEMGRFRLMGVPVDKVRLSIDLGSGNDLPVDVPAGLSDTEVKDIALPPIRSIDGSVRHSDGTRVERGLVMVAFESRGSVRAPVINGRFRIKGVASAAKQVIVRSDDRNKLYHINPVPTVQPKWDLVLNDG